MPTSMAPRADSEVEFSFGGDSGSLMAFLAARKAEMAAFMEHDLAIPASHGTAECRASWSYDIGTKTKWLSSAIVLLQPMSDERKVYSER